MQGYELTVGQLPCGVCLVRRDEPLTLLEANDTFYQLYGYTREEAEREEFRSIQFINYPQDWPQERVKIEAELEHGAQEFEVETRAIHRSGRLLWVLVRIRPQADGSLLAVVLDITERSNRLEQLQLSKEETQLALEHAGRFIFRYDLQTGCCTLSDSTARELGLPTLVEDVPESMIAGGNVDAESAAEYRRFFSSMRQGEPRGSMLVHFRNGRGEFAWYHCMFSMVSDLEGRPQHAVVSFEDVSQQREREMAYEQWSQYNRRQMAEAVVYYESNLSHNMFETFAGEEAGLIPQEVRNSYDETIRHVAENLVEAEEREEYIATFSREALTGAFQQGRREAYLEYRRKNAAGESYWASTTVQLLPDPYSNDIKSFALVRSIDQRKQREMEMERRSRTDALTGLLNRGATIEAVEHLLETSGPSARHAFLMMDIDCFKELNDTMGHRFGDQVLEGIAQGLRRSLRSGDVVGRLGGDEFVIFLRDMPLGQALEQKLVSICSLLSGLFAQQTLVSGSLGVAVYPRDGITFDELYQKADIALYQAKRGGRNQFMFYQPCMVQEDWKPLNDTPIDQEKQPGLQEDVYWTVRQGEGKTEEGNNVDDYLRAVHDSFDDLLVMNVSRDTCFALSNIPNKYRMPDTDGTLRDMLLQMAHQIHPGDALRFTHFFDWERVRTALQSGRRSVYSEFRKTRQGGGYCWVAVTVVPLNRHNQEEVYLCFVRDVDAHKQEQERWNQEKLNLCRQIEAESYRTIMEEAGTVLLEYNAETGARYASPAAREFTCGVDADRRSAFQLFTPKDVHPEDWPIIDEITRRVDQGQCSAGGTVRLRCTAGGYLWCNVTLTVLRGEDGSFHRSLVAINDVDETVKNREELVYRAEYDELTGYRNFTKFKADTVELLQHCSGQRYGLYYCDLRNFKLINDMYGYDFGDQVLRYWANVLARHCGEGEIFARVSADHFTILCRYQERKELEARFADIAALLAGYGELAGKKLRLELVGGIYCIESEKDVLSVQDMIDRANLAQKSVKRLDGSRCAFYNAAMRAELLWEKEMEADMRRALANGEFVPYFQPIVKLEGEERVCAAEALARWDKPGHGLVPPGEFIPLFEKNGFVVELDLYVFEAACRTLRRWLDSGYPAVKVAVNVSSVSVFQPDFEARYRAIKQQYGIPDGLVGLECTESTAVQNAQGLDRIMGRMRQYGFEFSMDDFGSGYSSLNLLKDVHAGVLKLDMMFLRHNKLQEARNKTIVSSILTMASALDMETIAEGVETAEQLTILRQLGCDYAQGFLFSPPVPAAAFEEQFLKGGVERP